MGWLSEPIKLMMMVKMRMDELKVQKDWPDMLQKHAMAYNISIQASTGYEPFFLMHGFHAATAVEVVLPTPVVIKGDEPVAESREQALRNLAKSQECQKKAYDRCHRDVTYQVGDWVLIEDITTVPGLTMKLRAPFKGPGRVIGLSADGLNCTCEFMNVNGQKKQVTHHVSHLKRYEVWNPLKLTIQRTKDGHIVKPSV